MDRFEAMTILVAVVEAGSFTGAGRRLRIPLPTVSRKVGELEAHLGTRLLTRSTRRLSLTDAGGAYVAACKRILEQIGDVEREIAGEFVAPKGELVVTAPLAFGRLHVIPVVAAFLAAHPQISVRLLLSDRNAQLLDDHIDLAVRIGTLPDSSLVAVKVGAVRRVVCASPDYLAAHGIPKSTDDLARHACVTFDSSSTALPWVFRAKSGKQDRPVPIQSRFCVNTAEAALDAVALGAGLTQVLSYQAARGVREGRLQRVLAAHEPAAAPVSLVHAAQGQLPLKLRSFIDFAAPALRASITAGSR